MDKNEFVAIMDRLDELQDDAIGQAKNATGPSNEQTDQSMYFVGKDTGIAEAKAAVRARFEDDDDE